MADIVKFPTRRFFITNEERASAALAAVEAFRNERAGSSLDFTDGMQEAIGDLIGDLCHLAARHKIPPFKMLELGAAYYVNEIVCEENSTFLSVKATLNVLAREASQTSDPYEVVDDESVAYWRMQVQWEYGPEAIPTPPEGDE